MIICSINETDFNGVRSKEYNRRYTPEEDDFIRSHYLIMTHNDIPKKLGRTCQAISSRCSDLCLKKPKNRKYTDNIVIRFKYATSIEKRLSLAKELCVSYDSLCEAMQRYGYGMCKLSKRFQCIIWRRYHKTNRAYKDYGGRGITVCDEWLNDDKNFIEWAINNGYQDGLTIDRINNDGPYSPNNCRWTNSTIQANNRRSNVLFTAFNETKTMSEWSRDYRCKISYVTLKKRYQKFSKILTHEELLTFTKDQVVQRKKQHGHVQ